MVPFEMVPTRPVYEGRSWGGWDSASSTGGPAHPLAANLQSPILLGTLASWFALFVLGTALQAGWIWSRRKTRV